jgi:hypothetical protein
MKNPPPVFAVAADKRYNLHGWDLSLWVGSFGNFYYLQSEGLSPRALQAIALHVLAQCKLVLPWEILGMLEQLEYQFVDILEYRQLIVEHFFLHGRGLCPLHP